MAQSIKYPQPVEGMGFHSPCDLRLYDSFNIPGLIWGPGDLEQAHAPNESIDVLVLLEYTKKVFKLITSNMWANWS